MKNFVLLVLDIILGATVMYFYTQNDVRTIEEPPMVKPPSGIISPAKIKTMTQAYNERYKLINDSLFNPLKIEDNRSSWFKLEVIEDYIAYAKQQAADNQKTMDGLRLYIGAHSTVDSIPGLTTLLFVPTGYDAKSKGSIFSFQGGGGDLTNSDGLNNGGHGKPPGANYPQ